MLKAPKAKIEKVRKRTGDIVDFDEQKIVSAINKAIKAVEGEEDFKRAERAASEVVSSINKKFNARTIPSVEEIQDAVEEALIKEGMAQIAKAYILYRNKRAELRNAKSLISENVKKLVRESKKYFRNPLSEFIYYRTYSRWIDQEGRRETWIETVDRYMSFMKENLGNKLNGEEYNEIREYILNHKAMPSMRLVWSAGKAARKTNVAAYNCSFIAPSKLEDFAEIIYLLMCGTGVGFSVESQTVQELPIIKFSTYGRSRGARQAIENIPTHTIEDSKEGWGDALTLGLKTWYGGKDIKFDYSRLRPAGARLSTMGGRSSGPEPLRALLDFSREKILAKQGKRLSNIDVHDIICKIGEVVVMGGVRRSALISLSDVDDEEMRHAKKGQFYIFEPQRAMANNSAAYNKKPSTADFIEEWLALAKSGTGERGIFNRAGLKHQLPQRRWEKFGKHWPTSGTNPCVTGDTLVYVADGRDSVPIKQLADEGKDVSVFCLDNRGKIAIRYMRHPRLTGKKQPVYRIVLDDNSSIKATGNHKFRLKSGEYKEVSDLKNGDSLHVATKFEASIKDIFPEANSRSQNYWWVNNGFSGNDAEHRLIAKFYLNDTKIPQGYIVHHKDRNAQNNTHGNLEVMTKKEHDILHARLMLGDANPMRRAKHGWSKEKWAAYKLKHSENNFGEKNSNFSGVSDEQIREHALTLTGVLGHRFSNSDWVNYASKEGLPQHFSKWRRDHLGGIIGISKWAAQELGLEYIDADPRVIKSYKKYTSIGYNCEIVNGQLIIIKNCEVCGVEFRAAKSSREYGVCGMSCGLKRGWKNPQNRSAIVGAIRMAHKKRKQEVGAMQIRAYTDLKFKLGKSPLKKEWIKACKDSGISYEISRLSSPIRGYDKLKEAASMYNHRVVSVELCGYENVYNGTVDEFHNFFVGAFVSKTRSGKRKFTYLNNLQCGEIILRSKQFCNLTEVVCREEDTKETLLKKVRIATILGTYQSALTNFSYLSKEWKQNCEEERLLGVSLTGQWDAPAARDAENLRALRDMAIETNKEYAKKFGINQSTCITCVKPSGTVSQLVDSSSGMHPRHANYYIRRVRISASDPLFQMLKDQKVPYYPEVGQLVNSASTYVIEFPIKAPESTNEVKDSLTAIEQLEHWKMVKENYTEHNPSVTISVGDDEWLEAASWLHNNWDMLGGLSFLPRSSHKYVLAPYEEINEARYNEMFASFPDVDFSQILAYERDDTTQGAQELACVAGVCEIEEVATGNSV